MQFLENMDEFTDGKQFVNLHHNRQLLSQFIFSSRHFQLHYSS